MILTLTLFGVLVILGFACMCAGTRASGWIFVAWVFWTVAAILYLSGHPIPLR